MEEYIENLDKELKLYDIVNYCNNEWYVIKIEEDTVTLMSKNIIGKCTYSDNNSNDFTESNCIKLLNDFMKKLNENDLMLMKINFDEDKFTNCLIRIPTLREIEKIPINVRSCGELYWTMTSSYAVNEDCDRASVFAVLSAGYLSFNDVNFARGVRPVIKIKESCLHE